jgi:hypothetical protein
VSLLADLLSDAVAFALEVLGVGLGCRAAIQIIPSSGNSRRFGRDGVDSLLFAGCSFPL